MKILLILGFVLMSLQAKSEMITIHLYPAESGLEKSIFDFTIGKNTFTDVKVILNVPRTKEFFARNKDGKFEKIIKRYTENIISFRKDDLFFWIENNHKVYVSKKFQFELYETRFLDADGFKLNSHQIQQLSK